MDVFEKMMIMMMMKFNILSEHFSHDGTDDGEMDVRSIAEG